MNNTKALTVTAAAIREKGGTIYTLPPPARHHNIIKLMAESGCPTPIIGEQGFLLSDGRFAMRKAAWLIAEDSGQLLPRAPTGLPGRLYSEDVW